MLESDSVVCFGPSDWWHMNPSCCTHIMRHLSRSNKVLYINPVSSDMLGIHSRKGLAARILRKLKSVLKFYRRIDKNLAIVSPVFVPLQGIPIIDWLNNVFLKFQLNAIMLFLRIKRPLLWVENIRAADLIQNMKWRLVVYHVSDRFEECPYTKNKDKLRERESIVTQNSDLIICVSKELFEHKKNAGAMVRYLPHGVDFKKFRNASQKKCRFPGLADCDKPIVGYFGTLTAQNDIELLEYCAREMPTATFAFAGQITGGDYEALAGMSNVVFLGKVPYEDIPSLCAAFDVCILPWRINKWIENCNPLKLFEYMASGKPIVSVPICEVKDRHSDIVAVAETKEQFCRAIENELNSDTEQRKHLRIETARRHDWDNHILQLSNIITDAISNKPHLN